MSIRSEIRAALVDGPKSTDEMLPLVPSVEGDRARLGQNVSVLANEQKVRRAGLSDDGRPLYQLDPKAWPAKDALPSEREQRAATKHTPFDHLPGPGTLIRKTKFSRGNIPLSESDLAPPKPDKATKKAKAPTKPAPAAPAKSQRPVHEKAAKVQRKTAKPRATSPGRAVTVATEPEWRVGLQLDGSVFAFDPAAGTHQVIAAPIVRQILGMAALLRPAA